MCPCIAITIDWSEQNREQAYFPRPSALSFKACSINDAFSSAVNRLFMLLCKLVGRESVALLQSILSADNQCVRRTHKGSEGQWRRYAG